MVPSPYPPHQPYPPYPPYPPQRPWSRRVMRVVWASFPVWSFGFLCWVPSLRLAIERRTARSWVTFAGIAAGLAAGIWIMIATSETGADKTMVATWPGVVCFLILIIAPTVHYCRATRVGVRTWKYQAPAEPYVSPEDVQAGLRELRGILSRREEP